MPISCLLDQETAFYEANAQLLSSWNVRRWKGCLDRSERHTDGGYYWHWMDIWSFSSNCNILAEVIDSCGNGCCKWHNLPGKVPKVSCKLRIFATQPQWNTTREHATATYDSDLSQWSDVWRCVLKSLKLCPSGVRNGKDFKSTDNQDDKTTNRNGFYISNYFYFTQKKYMGHWQISGTNIGALFHTVLRWFI